MLRAVDAEHLFSFLKSEVSQGKSQSQELLNNWFWTNFQGENPPPFPWEHVNELTDVISPNAEKPGVFDLLQPILRQAIYRPA